MLRCIPWLHWTKTHTFDDCGDWQTRCLFYQFISILQSLRNNKGNQIIWWMAYPVCHVQLDKLLGGHVDLSQGAVEVFGHLMIFKQGVALLFRWLVVWFDWFLLLLLLLMMLSVFVFFCFGFKCCNLQDQSCVFQAGLLGWTKNVWWISTHLRTTTTHWMQIRLVDSGQQMASESELC